MGIHPIYAALTSDAYVRTLISVKAHQLIRHLGFYQSDPEDIEHELIKHVLEQAAHFDPCRGSIHTFIARVADSKFKMMLRDKRALKRSSGPLRSLEDIIANEGEHPIQQGDVVTDADNDRRLGKNTLKPQDQVERDMDRRAAEESLDPKLRDLYQRRQEASEEAVAADLGLSRRQLRKQMELLRKHFEMKGFGP